MEKKVFISLPKGKEATNVQFNVVDGKIEVSYDLKEVFNPKDGDFLTTKDGRVFIYNGLNTDVQYGTYCGIDIYNTIKFSYLSPAWTCKKGCRYATEDEKYDFLVRLEDECGKTWDFKGGKLVDVIKPKPGDFVISDTNTMFIFLSKEKGLYCGIYDMKNQFGQHSKYSTCIKVASMGAFRYATEEEKKEYLDFIRQKFNQVWNPDKLSFENARWRAKNGEEYWYIYHTAVLRAVENETDINNEIRYRQNNYFRSPEDAEKIAVQIRDIFDKLKSE